MIYRRAQVKILQSRLAEPVRLMQMLAGPRQIGNTTVVRQLLDARNRASFLHEVADDITPETGDWSAVSRHILAGGAPRDAGWLVQVWQQARESAHRWKTDSGNADFIAYVLVIDEIQKITRWSDVVKGLWDADRAANLNMHVVLLGSAPLLIQQGQTESLAGRYEVIPMTHWGLDEIQDAFGLSLEQFIYFGGYPGAAPYIGDESRWRTYVVNALIRPSITKDILEMQRVEKPALLSRLFELGCAYSGQILSYSKMIGQLQDAGNTTTLAHYLDLLGRSGLITGLHKYAGDIARQRASSPKLNVQNTALMSATTGYTFAQAQADRSYWGRLVESAVGAHLLNTANDDCKVSYWRESPYEVDFVVSSAARLTSIEVKSGKSSGHASGLLRFNSSFNVTRSILVGDATGCDVGLAEMLSHPASDWLVSGEV